MDTLHERINETQTQNGRQYSHMEHTALTSKLFSSSAEILHHLHTYISVQLLNRAELQYNLESSAEN